MKPFAQFEQELPEEAAIDTPVEVDLVCGGVGFDDDPAGDKEWLRELRSKQKTAIENN